jgi:hypothetical protein
MSHLVMQVVVSLNNKRFQLHDEKALQKEIHSVLSLELPHIPLIREYHLDSNNILDLYIAESLGVEVKIKGGKRDLYRQCERYCSFDEVKELLLITNLSIGFPEQIKGKDCYVLKLGTAWL